jgi:cyclopropane-fatty-acyl-phospholipid synthase
MNTLINVAESGFVPDAILRAGIRRLLRQRLKDQVHERERGFGVQTMASMMTDAPIATDTETANDQHYELPAEFFQLMLGPRLKYSSCLWDSPQGELADAEDSMLGLTCDRAGVADGMSVLDLGSGWGSMGLWIAERFPRCRVTCVSNSAPQQAFIRDRAAECGLQNLETFRADVNDFEPASAFDRVISIEMFEHMRNYEQLLSRISNWLSPDGCLFVHIFCHQHFAYFYEQDGRNDWMARHFFTGGLMPSLDLLERFDSHLRVARRWTVNGTHYSRTLLAWLEKLDQQSDEALRILAEHYGPKESARWLVRWRLFLLACAELFGYRQGEEWLVGHYLLRKS